LQINLILDQSLDDMETVLERADSRSSFLSVQNTINVKIITKNENFFKHMEIIFKQRKYGFLKIRF